MRKAAAVFIGYLVTCAFTITGYVWSVKLNNNSDVELIGSFDLFAMLLLFGFPGFILLRFLLYLCSISSVAAFACAGLVNAAIVLNVTMGVLEIGRGVTVILGLSAGAAQWVVERLVNRAPVVG
jgi:hypothetical protein